MNFAKSPAYKETAGVSEPKLDLFSDVKRALNSWLMDNDKQFAAASRMGTERNQRIKERSGR
jgi:hypothetical protein